MADDRNKKGPHDRSRINLSEDYEVRYWSEKFRVTPVRLREAVKKVGNSAEAVEAEIVPGVPDSILTRAPTLRRS